MDTKIDMTYSFLQDDEPTDEQLHIIMQEVAEEARRENDEVAKKIPENIERECLHIRTVLQNQQMR
jgi:hypothetical protein